MPLHHAHGIDSGIGKHGIHAVHKEHPADQIDSCILKMPYSPHHPPKLLGSALERLQDWYTRRFGIGCEEEDRQGTNSENGGGHEGNDPLVLMGQGI